MSEIIVGAIHELPENKLTQRHRSVIDKMVGFLKMNTSKKMHCTYSDKIWQRSYHDHIIRDKNDYEKIWDYIDTNTINWQQDCFYNNP